MIVVGYIGAIATKVPTVDVVNIPVIIIVNAITGHLVRIDPGIANDVLVRKVKAAVDNRNDNRIAICRKATLPKGPYIRQTDALCAPLLVIVRVIGGGPEIDSVVGVLVKDFGLSFQPLRQRIRRAPGTVKLQQMDVQAAGHCSLLENRAFKYCISTFEQRLQCCVLLQLDQALIFNLSALGIHRLRLSYQAEQAEDKDKVQVFHRPSVFESCAGQCTPAPQR